jgi:hypothetical protein
MTGPDWDDERLAAAFRARFDRPAPPTLAADVQRAIAGTTPARFRPVRNIPAWGLAAAAVVVLVVAAAFGFGGLGRLGVGPSRPPGTAAVATPSNGRSPAATPAGPPASVLGLDVVTVSSALTVRDGGNDDREVAVVGWFTPAPPRSCGPVPLTPPTSPLQLPCPTRLTWLDERPESLVHVKGGTETTSSPLSPALNPDLLGLDTSWVPSVPSAGADGDSTPARVVFLGHFDDRRVSLCPTADTTACQDRFVVDSVAWVEGVAPPRSMLGLTEASATSSVADIEAIIANEAPQSPILSIQVVHDPADLASIEPSLASGQHGIIEQPTVWIVRVLESGRATTYVVVDGTGEIYELTPEGDAVLVGGPATPSLASLSPSPSAAPWPPAGATVIELTGEVGAGDQPIQVAVVDRSGRLAGVAEKGGAAAPDTLHVSDPWAYAEPGKPGRVHIIWTGGGCDSHITVTVAADLRTIEFDMGPQPANCDSIGIGRQLVLDFSGSVEVTAIEFVRASVTPTPGARDYNLDCGPIDRATCERKAEALVAANLKGSPGKRVESITFSDSCGSYTMILDDGTGTTASIDCVPR